jgi:hypothetical protein
MSASEEYENPSQLLIAILDSMNEPTCILNDKGKYILNDEAKKLLTCGLDISSITNNLEKNSIHTLYHKGVQYNVEKKDINHGTNSFVCKIIPVDDTIKRLAKSSERLKKAINNL